MFSDGWKAGAPPIVTFTFLQFFVLLGPPNCQESLFGNLISFHLSLACMHVRSADCFIPLPCLCTAGFYQHLWVPFYTCPCGTTDFPSMASIYVIINVNEVCLAINLWSSKFIPLAKHLARSGLCFRVTNWRTPLGFFKQSRSSNGSCHSPHNLSSGSFLQGLRFLPCSHGRCLLSCAPMTGSCCVGWRGRAWEAWK